MTRPNIILILPDQWRGDALSHIGGCGARTPYLDQLAAEGTTFTRAYSPSPTCVPARACLATGCRPWTCGRIGYQDGQAWDYRHTLMHRLRDAGYQTVNVGKTHFHPQRLHLGFEINRCYEARVREAGYESDYHRWLRRETGDRVRDPALERRPNDWPVELWEHEERLHNTRWIADESLEFLATRDPTRPFFLQIGFHRPHVPFDPPRRHWEMLRDRPLPEVPVGDWVTAEGAVTHSSGQSGRFDECDLDAIRRAYLANLLHIDEQVGRLVFRLEELGLADDTWIVFTSDHGELLGDHRMLYKATFHEGSARVPLIVRPPCGAGLPRGQHRGELVDLGDLLPSCCELADLAIEPAVDGRSILPLVRGEDPTWRAWWHGEHHGHRGDFHCLIEGDWKYLYESRSGHDQLFDLAVDPQERHDRATDPDATEHRARLRRRLVEHLADRGCGTVVDGELRVGVRLAPTRSD